MTDRRTDDSSPDIRFPPACKKKKEHGNGSFDALVICNASMSLVLVARPAPGAAPFLRVSKTQKGKY